jgi:phosphate starvation-inducible PhoH-like protein
MDAMALLVGVNDQHIELIEKHFDCALLVRNQQVTIQARDGKVVDQVVDLLGEMASIIKTDHALSINTLQYMLEIQNKQQVSKLSQHPIASNFSGKMIYPKTFGQLKFIDAMKDHDMVFAIGPAGTGKTYLAVVYAVYCLKHNHVKKIILTRPAVEAGENLGFLPGDLKEKVDPYLRPLYDALFDMLGFESTNKLIEKGVIEIAPLAYMRGRTLDDAFVILDEAQNTLPSQMKMFLTRMGNNSKIVVNGDITQIDLKKDQPSGLIDAQHRLRDIKAIGMVYLDGSDVVRHPLVKKILKKYES